MNQPLITLGRVRLPEVENCLLSFQRAEADIDPIVQLRCWHAAWLAVPVLVLALAVAPAQADESISLDQAFAAMMDRPDDPERAIRYARLAAASGQTRNAIVALERVLRVNPALDNVRLELASLRQAEGSSDLAASLAEEAMRSPDMPPEVAPRAAALRAQAERSSARSLLEISLFAGVRYDTNANEATSLGTVPVFVPVLQDFFEINTPVRGRSDFSMVLGARVAHRYDLGLQREGAWETNFSAFDQRFSRLPRAYDLSLVTFDTGPRIEIAEFGDGDALVSVRPFASLGWLGYGGRTYSALYGGGGTLELRIPPRWTFELTGASRFGNYENSDFRPTARNFTGPEHTLSVAAGYLLGESSRLSGGVYTTRGESRVGYYDRTGWGAFLQGSTAVSVTPSYSVGASATVGYRRTTFDEADVAINPDARRRDTRYEAGLLGIFPLTSNIAATAEYGWYTQRSNYSLYRYENHAITVGLRMSL